MKRIIRITLKSVLLSILFFCVFNIITSYAAETIFKITSLSVKEKSAGVTVNNVNLDTSNDSITNDVIFTDVNDYITYDIKIKNTSSDSYTIKSISDNNTSEYLDYTYDDLTNTVLSSNAEKEFNLTITYTKQATNPNLSTTETNLIITYEKENGEQGQSEVTPSVNPSNNPKTGDSIIIYFVLSSISIVGLIILSKTKKKTNILLVTIMLLIPLYVKANTLSLSIRFNNTLKAASYEVEINLDNGSNIIYNTLAKGAKIQKPENPSKRGYTFDNWYSSGVVYDFDTPVTGPVSLEARYTKDIYQISYDLDGGSLEEGKSNPLEYDVDSNFTLYNPSKTGHIFAGWQVNGGEELVNPVTISNEVGIKSFKAIYTPINYTITFDPNNGESTFTTTAPYGFKVNKPSNPTYNGYQFNYWALNNNQYDFNSTVQGEITLIAQYTPNGDTPYTVYHRYRNLNDSGFNTYEEHLTGETGALVNLAFRPQTGFDNPSSTKSLTISGNGDSSEEYIYERTNFLFTLNDTDSDVTTSTPTGSYPYETVITLTANNKAGHTFNGWKVGNETTYVSTSSTYSFTLTDAITISPVYTINTYTASFDPNNGEQITYDTKNYNETFTAPNTNPLKTGYTFQYWALNNSQYNFSTPATDNIDLVAYYTLDTYSISYDLNDGSLADGESNPDNYNYFTDSFTLYNPNKEGYSFVGWEDLDTGVISNNVTIYQQTGDKSYSAVYSKITYNIAYDLNGGSLTTSNPTTYDVETNTFTLNNPSKEGYKFTGWTGSNGSTPQTTITINQGTTGDKEYTANFEEIQILCKKATTLNSEVCSLSGGVKGCSGAGYNYGDTITYGNIASSDTIQVGDAYLCNVDGTGYNKRFYYLRTLNDKAVLIYSDNTGEGITIPNDPYSYLPTTSNWSNLEAEFDDNRVARFVSKEDLIAAAGTDNITHGGVLDSINFLFENTSYAGNGGRSTVWATDENGILQSRYHKDSRIYAVIESSKLNTSENNVRPVIEIPLEQLEHDNYIVRFDAHGGTVDPEYLSVVKGSSIGTLPTTSKPNSMFGGWYTTDQYVASIDENTIPSGYATYHAKWLLDVTNAILNNDNFVLVNGSCNHIVVSNANVLEPYTFTSNDESVVTVNNNGEITTVGAGTTTISMTGTNSTLVKTINVSVVEDSSDFVISFVTSGDVELDSVVTTVNPDPIADMNVEMNTAVNGLPEPGPSFNPGYTFGGWFTDTNFDTEVKDGDIIRNNMTLYAKWIPNTARAELNNNKFFTVIQYAVTAAPTTQSTIKILQDTTVTSGMVVNMYKEESDIDKTLTLDLNGHNIKATNDYAIRAKANLVVKNGTVQCSAGKGAVEINTGSLVIDNVRIEATGTRQALYIENKPSESNTASSSLGSPTAEIRGASYLVAKAATDKPRGTVHLQSGTLNILSGTIVSSTKYAVYVNSGTATIGTKDGTPITSTPVFIGEQYGAGAASNKTIRFYDGIIKGKTLAVENQSSVIPNNSYIEDNSQIVSEEDADGYKVIYLTLTNSDHIIQFKYDENDVNPAATTHVTPGDPITSAYIASLNPTKPNHTFDCWYSDTTTKACVNFPVTPDSDTTYYAKWTIESSDEVIAFNINNDALKTYFSNVNTWVSGATSANYTSFKSSMDNNFSANSCSSCCTGSNCENINNCNNPTSGNKCEQSIGYNTGITTGITVRVSNETTKVKNGAIADYLTIEDGKIYNMIPGVTYYWELNNNSNVYGYVKATGNRRTIYSTVRNVRDLGGMNVSFVRNNTTKSGTLNYGRLYRGAKLSTAADVTSLTNLGITREIDLRPDSEQSSAPRLNKYDKSESNTVTSSQDIIMHNYLIYPSTHMSNYKELRNTMKTVMEYIVNDNSENIYFHCTIGTDRTGTLAYFLEGLLGVSEQDRLKDYEITYYYGLQNRTRFHDNLLNSEYNPRFYTMYNTYRTNSEIYDLYMYGLVNGEKNLENLTKDELLFFADGLGLTGYTASSNDDELIDAIENQLVIEDQLIQNFRDKMISYN